MARQPLFPVRGTEQVSVVLGPQYIEQRPDHVAVIGRCLAYWPEILHQQAVLLGLLLGPRSQGAVAVISALSNSRTRSNILSAAAEYGLDSEKETDLVEAVMSVVGAAEKERNDLAHGCWGIVKELSDRILWVAPAAMSVWVTGVTLTPSETATDGDLEKLSKLLYTYKQTDLDGIYEQIAEAWSVIHHLVRYVNERRRAEGTLSPISDELFGQLIVQPRVAAALAHIEEGKRKKQLQQPQPDVTHPTQP